MKKTLLAASILVGLFVTGTAPYFLSDAPMIWEDPTASKAHAKDIGQVKDASSAIDGEWLGLCKKNSINSVASFQNIVQSDSVLSAYYSGFDWDNAEIKELQEPTQAHVAHRREGLIKNSSKTITLPKGDRYITDGRTSVRMFCCNSVEWPEWTPPDTVSHVPMDYVYHDPAPAIVESVPEVYTVEPAYFSVGYPVGQLTYRGRVFISDSPGINSPITPQPSAPVPEPSSFLLLGSGLILLSYIVRRRTNCHQK